MRCFASNSRRKKLINFRLGVPVNLWINNRSGIEAGSMNEPE
jgi:hypothetical protein